jgi:two-component system LytT family response regulator
LKPPGIRTFVVDDEPLARERMKHLLSTFSEIEIEGEFGNGGDCIEPTISDSPDLIFLDIGLPDYTGLEVVSELAGELDSLPLIVFATAYDQHAISAFELNALDYLLKPVSPDRLALTIDRIRSTLASQEAPPEEARLREWLSEEMAPIPKNLPARIEIRDRGNTSFVPVREIQYFQADGNYIEVHAGERAPLIRMTMAKLETQLNPDQFVRVSRSAIVAVTRVTSIEKKGRHEFWVHLDTGDRIAASRNLESLEQAIMKL